MTRLFALLLFLAVLALPQPSAAQAICRNPTAKVTPVGVSALPVPATALDQRTQVTICNSDENAASPLLKCRSDGGTPVMGAGYAGDLIRKGSCWTYFAPTNLPIKCIADTASTNVTSSECRSTEPLPNNTPAPTSSSATVSGSVTATQGTAGSAPWPVTGSGTAGSPATGVVSVQGVVSGIPIPMSSAYSGPVTATWTSATAIDTALQILTDGFTTVGIQSGRTGSITLGTIVFQVSNSVSGPWSTVSAGRTKGEQVDESYALSGISTTDPTAWQVFVSGYKYFQIKLSVAITNTGSVTLSVMASQAGMKPDTGIVIGSKATNTVLSGSNNLQVLPAISNAVAPTLTENYEQALSTTLTGNLRTTAAGARAGVTTECLVVTTAGGTPCPATPLASRRAVKLVNTGPNPIYCALGASVPVVLLADPILPTGWATYEAGPAVPVTCIAATASQVTTAATIVSELAQ